MKEVSKVCSADRGSLTLTVLSPSGSPSGSPGGFASGSPGASPGGVPQDADRSVDFAGEPPRDPDLVYAPDRHLRWLLLRPWILISRLIVVVFTLGRLAIEIVVQGNSRNAKVQQRLARRILTSLTALGPCFIKVGQALSTRPDLVRRDWLEELSRLQDDLPPFPCSIAKQTITTELGVQLTDVFAEFPNYPIAAASLGQVYRARLKDGRWVAVKVQRPNLPMILRRDLAIIRSMAVLCAPFLPLNLGFGLGTIIDEFGRSLFDEIDYRKEATNAEYFAQLFADHPEVTIPDVERTLSSRRVLTTTWINGVKMANRRELEAHHLDPAALIRTGVISGLRQLLEFGYFHADPHPGNLFALPGVTHGLGHMAYVDFGMMDALSEKDRLTLTGAVVHLINRDFHALARDFQALGFLNPQADIEPIIPALESVLGQAIGKNVGSFNFKSITDRFSELMYDYPFRVPARFALIIRAVVSQEGLALRLDPDFRILQVAYPYVARRLLAGDTAEMREKLLEVIFDENGRLRLERLSNLLSVVETDLPGGQDLLPVARDGLRLLFGPEGSGLRQRFLLSLVAENRLHTDDLGALIGLIGQHFSLGKLASGVLSRLNPLAA